MLSIALDFGADITAKCRIVDASGDSHLFNRSHALGTDDATIRDDAYAYADSQGWLDLDLYKLRVEDDCDTQGTGRVLAGFTYKGTTISMSTWAQINLNGVGHRSGRLTYPYPISNIDNTASITLDNLGEAAAMVDAGFDHKAGHLENCTTVKNNVRAAANKAAVDAAAASWLGGGDP